MQIIHGNPEEINLVAERTEEIKLLREMWDNGIFRQAFNPGTGHYSELIISARRPGQFDKREARAIGLLNGLMDMLGAGIQDSQRSLKKIRKLGGK